MVKIDDQIEVMVLHIDYEKEKIALGLKQKSASPWENVPDKYPVGSVGQGHGRERHELRRVREARRRHRRPGAHQRNVAGPSGSAIPASWCTSTRRSRCMVLDINKEKQEISLGMKQTQSNPWDKVADRYPPGAMVKGRVRNLTNYGAFIEIEEGIDGLLHVSDMSLDPQDRPSQRSGRKGPGSRVQGGQRRSGTPPHRARASSRWTTIRGRPTSRTATSRASS